MRRARVACRNINEVAHTWRKKKKKIEYTNDVSL